MAWPLLKGETPPGVTNERSAQRQPPRRMSDDEKIHSAAAAAGQQQHGYGLTTAEEQVMIEQVAQTLNSDPVMRARIIASMDEILNREF